MMRTPLSSHDLIAFCTAIYSLFLNIWWYRALNASSSSTRHLLGHTIYLSEQPEIILWRMGMTISRESKNSWILSGSLYFFCKLRSNSCNALDPVKGIKQRPVIVTHPASFNFLSVCFASMHCNTAPKSSSFNFAAKDVSISSKSSVSHCVVDIMALLMAERRYTELLFCQEVEGALIATANKTCDGFAK